MNDLSILPSRSGMGWIVQCAMTVSFRLQLQVLQDIVEV